MDVGLTGLKGAGRAGSSATRGRQWACLLQLLDAAPVPRLMAPSSVFKASNVRLSPSHVLLTSSGSLFHF